MPSQVGEITIPITATTQEKVERHSHDLSHNIVLLYYHTYMHKALLNLLWEISVEIIDFSLQCMITDITKTYETHRPFLVYYCDEYIQKLCLG